MTISRKRCDICGGSGQVFKQYSLDGGDWIICSRCHGSGKVNDYDRSAEKPPKGAPAGSSRPPKKSRPGPIKTNNEADYFAILIGFLAGSGTVYLCVEFAAVFEWWGWLLAFLLPYVVVHHLVRKNRALRIGICFLAVLAAGVWVDRQPTPPPESGSATSSSNTKGITFDPGISTDFKDIISVLPMSKQFEVAGTDKKVSFSEAFDYARSSGFFGSSEEAEPPSTPETTSE